MRSNRLSRRGFLQAGAATLALVTGGRTRAQQPVSRPNMLLVITDQQHIDSIAAGGCPHVRTPAMDRLMRTGVSFRNSYSADPVCSPARSAIFSGRMASETGVYVNGIPIRKGIPNLGEWFSEHTDYETIYAGKWHVPKTHTFDIPGFRVLHTGIGGQGNLGDTATSLACCAYLKNRVSRHPFLMVASFLQPHDICEWLRINMNNPAEPPYPELDRDLPPLPENFAFVSDEPTDVAETRQRCEPAKGGWTERQWRYYRWSYYRHVEMVDGEIDRLLRTLDECRLTENTLVLLTSDHGEGMGHHQNVRKSLPYDEAAKVPFIVSWPGTVRENVVDRESLVSGVDIMPTLCGFAGTDPPPQMRGANLRGLLERGSGPANEFVVSEMPGNDGRVLRTKRYKYVTYAGDDKVLFFDMEKDPGESVNVAADPAHAKALATHRRLLADWEAKLEYEPEVPNQEAFRA